MATWYPAVWVKDSESRRNLMKYERANSHVNAYGFVVTYDEPSQKFIPVICGHGGSMWLCPECAKHIVEHDKKLLPLKEDVQREEAK